MSFTVDFIFLSLGFIYLFIYLFLQYLKRYTLTDHLSGSTTDQIPRMTPIMTMSVVRYRCTTQVLLRMITGKYGNIRTNTDCHGLCRIVSVDNPASNPRMCDLSIKWPLKTRQNKEDSLMKVESIAECSLPSEHSEILLICIKR